jgi:mRNA interferase RelE/StbE
LSFPESEKRNSFALTKKKWITLKTHYMYKINISESALKQLHRLPKQAVKKIDAVIIKLGKNPRPPGVKKLKGMSEDLYRIRVGDYRVIYSIEEIIKLIDVRQVGVRKDIYR